MDVCINGGRVDMDKLNIGVDFELRGQDGYTRTVMVTTWGDNTDSRRESEEQAKAQAIELLRAAINELEN